MNFNDVTGQPVIVSQPTVVVSDADIKHAQEEQKHDVEEGEKARLEEKADQAAQAAQLPEGELPQAISAPSISPITVEAQLQPPPPPPPKPKRSMKEPVRMTYDFRNLFQSKYYWKYRDMLNTAATLVAEKKLDDALEYYYVIADQNIPSSFRLMIQQNIKDIEETIADTFRYSDTIVKMDEAGDVARVRIVEKEELVEEQYEFDGEHRAVRTGEVSFRDD